MSNNYHEKRKRKLEAYQKFSGKAEERSKAAYEGARQIMDYIPLGQPILTGHYSEKRHRRDLSRIDSLMSKSINEDEKAEYYRNKINIIENNKAISSDDPDALEKLKEKLTERVKIQEYMKEENKKAKKEGKDRKYAAYQLQNNNQNISSIKKRIEALEKRQGEITRILFENDNIKILDNIEENRLQIFYSSIPAEEIRTKLKQNGFKWSKYNGCWQRFRSNQAVYFAGEINNIVLTK
jgi:hypothetical protein